MLLNSLRLISSCTGKCIDLLRDEGISLIGVQFSAISCVKDLDLFFFLLVSSSSKCSSDLFDLYGNDLEQVCMFSRPTLY